MITHAEILRALASAGSTSEYFQIDGPTTAMGAQVLQLAYLEKIAIATDRMAAALERVVAELDAIDGLDDDNRAMGHG